MLLNIFCAAEYLKMDIKGKGAALLVKDDILKIAESKGCGK